MPSLEIGGRDEARAHGIGCCGVTGEEEKLSNGDDGGKGEST